MNALPPEPECAPEVRRSSNIAASQEFARRVRDAIRAGQERDIAFDSQAEAGTERPLRFVVPVAASVAEPARPLATATRQKDKAARADYRADLFARAHARQRPGVGRFTILDLGPISTQRRNDCRFMAGRFFCGARTKPGASWCNAHAAVVFEASAT